VWAAVNSAQRCDAIVVAAACPDATIAALNEASAGCSVFQQLERSLEHSLDRHATNPNTSGSLYAGRADQKSNVFDRGRLASRNFYTTHQFDLCTRTIVLVQISI